MRTLAFSDKIEPCTLTTIREWLVKVRAIVINDGQHVSFPKAFVSLMAPFGSVL